VRRTAPAYWRWASLLLPIVILFSYRTCHEVQAPNSGGRGFTQLPKLGPGGGGMTTVPLAQLPQHVRRVVEHLRKVPHWWPLKGFKGGRIVRNREKHLPSGTNSREYDVYPLQPNVSRGAERLVVDESKRFFYYTTDHYTTFTKILLP